uniref:Metallophosphoesterase n=1 Tax=uncultured bacterium contig00048 TaxID=1181533 RepID=A0A806K264_9BACT|nr:hypothetical protein [uncultured bacterium contig00048]
MFAFLSASCSGDSDSEGGDISNSSALSSGSGGGLEGSSSSASISIEKLGLTPGSTTESLNLAWYSNTGSENEGSYARLFDSEGNAISTASDGIYAAAVAGKLFHKITINGLAAGTAYKYAVSNNGRDWSDKYDYKVPAAGAFRFAAVSDPQITLGNQDPTGNYISTPPTVAQGWKDAVAKIAATGASLIIGAGDQIDQGAGDFEEKYALFFAPTELRNIPYAPSVGNHDTHCNFLYHYNLPNERVPGTTCTSGAGIYGLNGKGFYYYIYNNVLFVMLNTSAPVANVDGARQLVSIYEEIIVNAKTANSGRYDWIVVFQHKPTQSVADHSADKDVQYYVEAGFERLMTAQGVDLVVSGHDHIFAKSKLLKQGSGDLFSRPSTDGTGTIYLTITSVSGSKFYAPFICSNNPNYPYLANGATGCSNMNANNLPIGVDAYLQNAIPQYTIVDVDGANMTLKTYGLNGVLYDEFSLSPTLQK